jgi:hypothetical protein
MAADLDVQAARRTRRGTRPNHQRTRRPTRTVQPDEPDFEAQAAAALEMDGLQYQAPRGSSFLMQVLHGMEGTDWLMLLAVATTIAVAVILGLFSTRLPTSAEEDLVAPTPTLAALESILAASPLPPTVAPTAIASPTSVPRAQTLVDTGGGRAMLRSAPGLKANIVERVANGTTVTDLGAQTTGEGRTWRQVRTPGGNEGWIATNLLRGADAPPAAAPTPMPQTAPRQ